MDEITDAEILNVAASARFTFDVDLRDGGDSYIVAGDGTDDIDHLLFILSSTRATVKMDVEPSDTSFKDVTVADVIRLREAFLTYYTGTSTGTLNKVDEYVLRPGVAFASLAC